MLVTNTARYGIHLYASNLVLTHLEAQEADLKDEGMAWLSHFSHNSFTSA